MANYTKREQSGADMHRWVCEGSITLGAAQDAFRGNWTVAYQRDVR